MPLLADERKSIPGRYRRARGEPDGWAVDELLIRYEQKRKLKTDLIPAPWSHVLFIAVLSAFAIFLIKLFIFEFIGRPHIESVTPDNYLENSQR